MTKLSTISVIKLAGISWILCLMPAIAMGQMSAINLSKNADFSTEDRSFYFDETLHVSVSASRLNVQNMDKNELSLSAVAGGASLEKQLTHVGSGVFEGAFDLDALNSGEVNWEVEIRLEDRNEREIREKIVITIVEPLNADDEGDATDDPGDGGTDVGDGNDGETGGEETDGETEDPGTGDDAGNGDGNDTGEGADDNNGDDAQEEGADAVVQVAGVVSSIKGNSIEVLDNAFTVDAQTVIKNDADTAIPFAWLSVGAEVSVVGIRRGEGVHATEIILHLELGAFFHLQPNYPNPFRDETTIQLEVFEDLPAETRIAIYDATGREVDVLVDALLPAGRYAFQWDAVGRTSIARGVYFCRVQIGDFSQTRKIVLQ